MPDLSNPTGMWYLKTWYPGRSVRPGVPRVCPEWLGMAEFPLLSTDEDVRRTLWPIRIAMGDTPMLFTDSGVGGPPRQFTVDRVAWDPAESSRVWSFRQGIADRECRWYRGRIVEGVFVGRFTDVLPRSDSAPTYSLSDYPNHVRGWNASHLDQPDHVAFEVVIENGAPDLPDSAYNTAWRTSDRQPRVPRDRLATVRIQRTPSGVEGRLKIFGWPTFTTNPVDPVFRGAGRVQRLGEEIEYDLRDVRWEGNRVRFTRVGNENRWVEHYEGTIRERWIEGTWQRDPGPRSSTRAVPRSLWRGARTRVLAYGLRPKEETDRSEWQERTRVQMRHLLMGKVEIERTRFHVGTTLRSVEPLPGIDRDDFDSAGRVFRDANERRYTFRELHLEYDLSFRDFPGERHTRRIHGFVSVPDEPPPATGYPLMIAINGHGGSAFTVLCPGVNASSLLGIRTQALTAPSTGGGGTCRLVPIYRATDDRMMSSRCREVGYPVADVGDFYGDAFARRGFVVLSIDIGHRGLRRRPLEADRVGNVDVCGNPRLAEFDRQATYQEYGNNIWPADELNYYGGHLDGEDPFNGNGFHPWIALDSAPTYPLTPDWVENGERVWDVEQSLSFLLGQAMGSPSPLFEGRGLRIDGRCVAMAGLSMGGEITALAGALDPRIKACISAGWSPDIGLFGQSTANHPCGQWIYAEVAEYADTADYHALIAPRPLTVETQYEDNTYSFDFPPIDEIRRVRIVREVPLEQEVVIRRPYFASDKETIRRGGVAYAGHLNRYIHFIHSFFLNGAPHTFATWNVRTQVYLGPAPGDQRLGWQFDRSSAPIAGVPGITSLDATSGPNIIQLVRALCADLAATSPTPVILLKREVLDKHWSVEKIRDLKNPKELAELSRLDRFIRVLPETIDQPDAFKLFSRPGRPYITAEERPLEGHRRRGPVVRLAGEDRRRR